MVHCFNYKEIQEEEEQRLEQFNREMEEEQKNLQETVVKSANQKKRPSAIDLRDMPEVTIQNFDLSVLVKKDSSFRLKGEFDPAYNDLLNDMGESLTENSLDDSEYHTILQHLKQPPHSLRKNAPLNMLSSRMPQWFKKDSKYEIKKDVILVPSKLLTEEQELAKAKGLKRDLKSPPRGYLRLCRIIRRREQGSIL